MSAFGAKRKARKITVQDDDDTTSPSPVTAPEAQDFAQEPPLQASFKSRKPARHSSLRKSINVADAGSSADSTQPQPNDAGDDDDDGGAPLRVRPSLGGRTGSNAKPKKRASSARLSFGPSAEPGDDDEDSMILGEEPLPFTPKKSSNLAAAASENSAYKKGIVKNSSLPLRSMEAEEDRPRYSKEYLSELQSSTPNTPADLKSLQVADDDGDVEMGLDPSELEGATVVESTMTAPSTVPEPSQTAILTEAEILEKKARRARLGAQTKAEDFISLDDDGDGDAARGAGESYLSVLSRRQTQPVTVSAISSKEKRLVKDDNLDEDDSFFVEDGGLSLGKKAERAARRKKRADMAAMIATAEGADGDETSDDSEAERRAAYESAQTRAGMDGLAEEREQQRLRLGRREGAAAQVPPKITPLPDLSVLVEEFKAKMARKELELKRMQAGIRELTLEKEGIERREPEVQQLLNEAGERYKALMGHGDVGAAAAAPDEADGNGAGGSVAAAQSLLEKARPADTPGRGLESLGATPVRTEQMEM